MKFPRENEVEAERKTHYDVICGFSPLLFACNL